MRALQLKNITDIYNVGIITFVCPAYPDTLWNVVLVANTEQHFTFPPGATCVQIDYKQVATNGNNNPANVWVRLGDSSVRSSVPSINNTSDGSGCVVNPNGFTINRTNTTISLCSDANTSCSLSFWTSLTGIDQSGT